MLSNQNEYNSVGGGYGNGFSGGFGGFGGYGGFGGIAPIGLVGINNLFGRERDHDHGGKCRDNDGVEHPLAILAAIGNSKDATVAEGRGVLAAIVNNNNQVVAEGRALASAICESEKTNLQQFYAAAIQASNNTQAIKDQATAFAIVNDKRFDDLAAAGVAQTAAILAKLNQTELDNLRDQLHESRRGRDFDSIRIENTNTNTNIQAQLQAQAQAQLQRENDDWRRRYDHRETEINIQNTNTNVNAQAQAQAQAQFVREVDRDHRWNQKFDAVLSQTNKANQDIVNLGTMVASGTQTPTSTNVNSKQA